MGSVKIEINLFVVWYVGVVLVILGTIFEAGFGNGLIVGGLLFMGSAIVFKIGRFLADDIDN